MAQTNSLPLGGAAVRSPRRGARNAGQRLFIAATIGPMVLGLLVFWIYPLLNGLWGSFTDWQAFNPDRDFVGLDNYATMVRDSTVRDTAAFTVFFTVVSVGLQVVLGLAVAMLLNRAFLGRSLARAVNLLPWAMSAIVIGTAASWVFNQDYGLVNDLIWRTSGARPLWLADVFNARMAVVLTDVWKNTPFLSVVFLGGLQGISPELREAAKIDGANAFRAFWSITVPLLMPLIVSMAIFTAIYRVLSFEIVYALTEGGPGTATSLMSYQVYLQAFRVLNFGYASALSMGLFAMVLLVGLSGFVLLRRAWARLD